MPPDRISCLPCNVIDQILSCLPLREAVRTSVLSTEWRYKWTTIADLVFDYHGVSEAFEDVSVKLAGIIDHVLSLHSAPINKFKVFNVDVTDADHWILHLTSKSVNEFVLENWDGPPNRGRDRDMIPSCLFACQSLVCLELVNYRLKSPSTFQGFKKLKKILLMDVTLAQDVFENFMSSCPLLEMLELFCCDGLTHLNIDVPNLRELEIGLENTFHLADVSIGLFYYCTSKRHQLRPTGSSSNLLEFFVHLPHVRRLKVEESFVEYLAVGIVPLKLPIPCVDLNYLSIHINFNDSKEISAALCLLRSPPNLRKLRIVESRHGKATLPG